ncbi:stress protein [Frankia sp. R43]|uniref:TerD family protein n=1 Tax=Frankia sp. R43 TaxID=269536 RepID=UPI0006DB05D0|nr:TerD family protein [Frankia sp. R43]KPM51817.1 stress protein [Frankia sp. R43]
MTAPAISPTDRPAAHSHPFAVVDVETSGLAADRDRILSIAVVQVGADGSVGERWTTLLDPGCDPGPVHIHGLTRELLAGSPTFVDVVDELAARLAGRVMVAHNASFDWRFLTAEAARAGRELPIERRMCSCVLARRLDLPVPDFRLATIADFWAVPFERQHDALADALVVAEVLPRMLALAGEQDLELPITAADRTPAPRPARAPRARCAFVNPGPLAEAGLIQGMRIAFTGETDTPRDRLEQLAVDAGLAVATSVSRRTSVLVTNHAGSGSGKAKAAVAHGVPVIDEATFLRLAADVAAGSPRDVPAPALVRAPALVPTPVPATAPAPAAPAAASAASTAAQVPAARGGGGPAARRPFAVRRVLVLGGPHAEAAALRERVIDAGGLAAVNLTASVTDVVCLPGGEADRRMARIRTLGLPVTTADTFLRLLDDLLATGRRVPVQPSPGAPRSLVRGAVVDLPVATAGARWTVAATWAWDSTVEIDLVAFLVGVNELVGDDDDFVFFNQPHTDDGAVSLSVDGPSEQAITLDLMTLPSSVHRVVIAAALGDGRTFGDIGPVNVAARTPDGQPWLHATLDAATTERTMVLAEVYRRNGMWRFRAVGQGHDHGLVDLARGYGVDATD